jgi:hypothetical protein
MRIARSMAVAALVILSVTAGAEASSLYGKVTFVGTVTEEAGQGGFYARFRVRVSSSTCDANTTPQDRWLTFRSGRTDGLYAHNATNTRNAYTTFLTAMLTGKNIQVDGASNCTASQIVNLWTAQVGIY